GRVRKVVEWLVRVGRRRDHAQLVIGEAIEHAIVALDLPVQSPEIFLLAERCAEAARQSTKRTERHDGREEVLLRALDAKEEEKLVTNERPSDTPAILLPPPENIGWRNARGGVMETRQS